MDATPQGRKIQCMPLFGTVLLRLHFQLPGPHFELDCSAHYLVGCPGIIDHNKPETRSPGCESGMDLESPAAYLTMDATALPWHVSVDPHKHAGVGAAAPRPVGSRQRHVPDSHMARPALQNQKQDALQPIYPSQPFWTRSIIP